MKQLTLFLLVLCFSSCIQTDSEHQWLSGNEHHRIDTVARHLRGNDVVMWEVDFRYKKLYEALEAKNDAYALYQLKKIKLAMSNGSERRPKRKKSYEWFFTNAIPPMEKAINEKGDTMTEFKNFTNKCMTCHSMEGVPFMPIEQPWLSHN
ncbi:hypothetical protein LNTAR_17783 [Lentisphaera araneosa HTCC2155]|uniref:Cytochrome c domain-containing protein n=1 Tax=Lentisphaera araneosa HTCC2155 TaxID=313628 RepID=A6DFP5_9BACT|nr:hypothetical protein [Lentisphaera araneosa]EDM29625.1 hypothetical protein LNTAR_17783 [Lentisphaera araneosa HTCC2155]